LIAGLAMGVVGLAVGGIVIYKVTRPKSDQAAAAPNEPDKDPPGGRPVPGLPPGNLPAEPKLPPEPALPEGWIRFTAKEVNLSLHLPGQPSGPSEAESEMLRTRVRDLHYSYEMPARGALDLVVMIIPPGTTVQTDEQAVFRRLPRHQIERLGKGRVVAERSATLAGSPATELECVMPDDATVVCRYAFVRAGGHSLFVIATAAGLKLTPAEREAFLNSIRPAGK
jgi:hypothetical protein